MKKIKDILALTPMQEGMLFHYLKDPGSDANFEQLYLEISGELERGPFEKAWNFVIDSNEMLRAVFRWENVKQPAQLVVEEYRLDIRYFDLSDKSRNEKTLSIEKIKTDDRNEKFDLQEVPFRVTLCTLAEIGAGQYKYGMIITNHHILYDGWSSGIILKEFFCAYHDLSRGKIPLKPFKSKFKEFIKWLHGQDKEEQASFWKKYLGDMERPGGKEKQGRKPTGTIKNTGTQRITFPAQQAVKLEEFCKKYRISPSSFFYCVWGFLLQQYHRRGDLLFDATVSGRSAQIKGIEDMVGLFINTLPVRINTLPGENVLDMMQRIDMMLRRWKEFEHTPLLFINELLAEYNKAGSLFDSVMVIENYPLDVKSLLENRVLPFSVDSAVNTGMTAYDLSVLITLPGGGHMMAEFTYDNALFDQNTIDMVTGHFVSLVAEMAGDPWKPLSAIELPGGEKEALRRRFEKRGQTVPEIMYIAPADEVEKKLAAVWAEVLKVDKERIGVQADFFAFGGHSLKASLLATALHREFNVKIPMAEIFRRPTIREMARYIKGAPEAAYTPIQFVEEKSYYPLSSAQKRIAALQRLDPGSTAYNVSSAVEVQGPLDTARLAEVFHLLIARHEIFRTSFQYLNGELFQRIQDNVDFAIEIESIEMGHSRFVRPFDLSKAPLLRVGLANTGEERRFLIMDMHHIITDGVSMNLFIKEFIALYKGEQLPLPVHRYKDFCQWQTLRLNSGDLKSEEGYWLAHLSGELPVLNLRTDFPRPLVQGFAGDRMTFHLEEECTRELYKLAGQTGTTLFMVFLAALNILLSRYSSQEDIIVGTTAAGRDHIDVQNVMGLFIETLALRNRPVGHKPFSAFLKEVKENTLNAFENEAYPFRELMEKLGAANDIARNPLFNVMLIVQNIDMARLEIGGLTFAPVDFRSTDSKVDFTVEVFEDESGIRFSLEYSTALFRKDTMERLALHFTNILNEVVNRPGGLLSEIDMLSHRERVQLLEEFSGSSYEKPVEMYLPVHRLFEKQAELTPGHIAVVFAEKRTTYRELNEKADALSEIIKGL